MFEKFGNPKLAKRATVIFLAFLMFVGLVYASYWLYSNIVTVTTPSLVLTYKVNLSSGTLINVTLIATIFPNMSGKVEFLNVTQGQQSLANVTLSDGIATLEINAWNNTRYQARVNIT